MKYLYILLSAFLISCYPAAHKIETITFRTDGGMLRANSLMSIDSNRHAVRSYTTDMGERVGPVKCVIDSASFNKIISELTALNFPHLKDEYTENATDCASYTLTITYDNGKVKRIDDYCRQGPKGLLEVYEDLIILESSQKWK